MTQQQTPATTKGGREISPPHHQPLGLFHLPHRFGGGKAKRSSFSKTTQEKGDLVNAEEQPERFSLFFATSMVGASDVCVRENEAFGTLMKRGPRPKGQK